MPLKQVRNIGVYTQRDTSTSDTHAFLGNLFPMQTLSVPKQLTPKVTIHPSLPGIEGVPETQDYQF